MAGNGPEKRSVRPNVRCIVVIKVPETIGIVYTPNGVNRVGSFAKADLGCLNRFTGPLDERLAASPTYVTPGKAPSQIAHRLQQS